VSKPLVAILDTCVLYPAIVRDTLLLAAEKGAYQLRWTDEILAELRRNLIQDRVAPAARVDKMLVDLASFFDDGRVSGYERHLPALRNDPEDRHVVAAALEGGAELIVTANLKDFAPETMPGSVRAISVDEFLLELLEGAPAEMIDVVRLQATRKKHPPMSVEQVLSAISRSAPSFAGVTRALLDLRTEE
jgi:predicted nucleic acid-binding protein